LELVAGYPLGEAAEPPPPGVPNPGGPRAALEAATLEALRSGRCFISFSGGRDSGLVLAAAVSAARCQGLPLPVPITQRFPGVEEAEESEWQESLVSHLGLSEWVRLEPGEALDQLGPYARRTLKGHGVGWPYNAFFHAPICEAAAGGWVLTGVDGDGLFDTWEWNRLASVIGRVVPPRPRDALNLARSLAPPWAKALWVMATRDQLAGSWLRPAARRALLREYGTELAGEPRRWDRRIAWWARRRYLVLCRESLGAVASDAGARISHPLLDPDFLATIAVAGGRTGYRSRTTALPGLFPGLLPPAHERRLEKAGFDEVFWGRESREFAQSWDGVSGLPEGLVDPARLREEWLKPLPDARSALLLQAAWLAAETKGCEKSRG
jgi:asparagine synthase (glutamine-hydrolysing)